MILWQKINDKFAEKALEANQQARGLAFAGLALIWIFKTDGQNALPSELVLPAALLGLFLLLDLLQYTWGAVAWGSLSWRREKEVRRGFEDNEKELAERYSTLMLPSAPNWINAPSNISFFLKLGVLIVGYVLIIKYIRSVWLG